VRNHWRVRDPKLNKSPLWTYYRGAKREDGIDAGATTVAFVQEKGWFWYIPQHNDLSAWAWWVGGEGKYLTRGGVRALEQFFNAEIEEEPLDQGTPRGRPADRSFLRDKRVLLSRPHCAMEGLLLVATRSVFSIRSSLGLMFALKSGVLAADAVHAALQARDFSPARFAEYRAATLRHGMQNMRKLVYAFYDPKFQYSAADRQVPRPGRAKVTIVSRATSIRISGRLFAANRELRRSAGSLALRPAAARRR